MQFYVVARAHLYILYVVLIHFCFYVFTSLCVHFRIRFELIAVYVCEDQKMHWLCFLCVCSVFILCCMYRLYKMWQSPMDCVYTWYCHRFIGIYWKINAFHNMDIVHTYVCFCAYAMEVLVASWLLLFFFLLQQNAYIFLHCDHVSSIVKILFV